MNLKPLRPQPFTRRIVIPFIIQLFALLLLVFSSGCTSLTAHDSPEATNPFASMEPMSSQEQSGRQCKGQSVAEHGDSTDTSTLMVSANADQLTPPYRVPLLRKTNTSRATSARDVATCRHGRVRYCDHRKDRCQCVSASSMDVSRPMLPNGF